MPRIRNRSDACDGRFLPQALDYCNGENHHIENREAPSWTTIPPEDTNDGQRWEGESEVSELSELTELSDDESPIQDIDVDHSIDGRRRTQHEYIYDSDGESEKSEIGSEEETVATGDIAAYWTRKKRASAREQSFTIPTDETRTSTKAPTYTLHRVEDHSAPKIKTRTIPVMEAQNVTTMTKKKKKKKNTKRHKDKETQTIPVGGTVPANQENGMRMIFYTYPTIPEVQPPTVPTEQEDTVENTEVHPSPDEVPHEEETDELDSREATPENESPVSPALEGKELPPVVAHPSLIPMIKVLQQKALAICGTSLENWDRSKVPDDDCEGCLASKGYRGSRQGLRRHVMTHYPDGFFCPVCDRLFAREDSLDRHLTRLPASCLENPQSHFFLIWRTQNNQVGRLLDRRYFSIYYLGAMEDFPMREDHFTLVAIRKRNNAIIRPNGKKTLRNPPDFILRFQRKLLAKQGVRLVKIEWEAPPQTETETDAATAAATATATATEAETETETETEG